jgi:hypothetical protein
MTFQDINNNVIQFDIIANNENQGTFVHTPQI